MFLNAILCNIPAILWREIVIKMNRTLSLHGRINKTSLREYKIPCMKRQLTAALNKQFFSEVVVCDPLQRKIFIRSLVHPSVRLYLWQPIGIRSLAHPRAWPYLWQHIDIRSLVHHSARLIGLRLRVLSSARPYLWQPIDIR